MFFNYNIDNVTYIFLVAWRLSRKWHETSQYLTPSFLSETKSQLRFGYFSGGKALHCTDFNWRHSIQNSLQELLLRQFITSKWGDNPPWKSTYSKLTILTIKKRRDGQGLSDVLEPASERFRSDEIVRFGIERDCFASCSPVEHLHFHVVDVFILSIIRSRFVSEPFFMPGYRAMPFLNYE